MKKIVSLGAVFCISLFFCSVYADEAKNEIPIQKTMSAGEELKVPVKNIKSKKVVISARNLLDEESVFFISEYAGGKERPEEEIGPKKYRTTTLNAKVKDEGAKIRLDRKTKVFDTSHMDEVYIKVEKGKIEVEVKEEKKRL